MRLALRRYARFALSNFTPPADANWFVWHILVFALLRTCAGPNKDTRTRIDLVASRVWLSDYVAAICNA
jgi:hypothetical protein